MFVCLLVRDPDRLYTPLHLDDHLQIRGELDLQPLPQILECTKHTLLAEAVHQCLELRIDGAILVGLVDDATRDVERLTAEDEDIELAVG